METQISKVLFSLGCKSVNASNYKLALKLFKIAAKRKCCSSCFNVGWILEHVNFDMRGAMEWYLISAKKGHLDSQFNLGWLLFKKFGQEHLGFRWILKAANQGHVSAEYNMGCFFARKKQYHLAYNWFYKAGSKGHSIALYNIGIMYENGQGTNRDFAKAFNNFVLSSKLGNHYAKLRMGVYYEYGIHVALNLENAIYWYTQAYIGGGEYDYQGDILRATMKMTGGTLVCIATAAAAAA